MNQTIDSVTNQNGREWISSRSLFSYMGIQTKQNFVGFMRHRIRMLKLEAEKDYIELPHWREHDKAPMLIEFRFTLESAIAITEYSRNSKALAYLIRLSPQAATPGSEANTEPELPLAQPALSAVAGPEKPSNPVSRGVKTETLSPR